LTTGSLASTRWHYDPPPQRGEVPLAREQRKLAAILAADVIGYSRFMGRNESGTLARLRNNRTERLNPLLAKYGGRLVKLTGDGALAARSNTRVAHGPRHECLASVKQGPIGSLRFAVSIALASFHLCGMSAFESVAEEMCSA
jgi:class 3 adenylate cyclase